MKAFAFVLVVFFGAPSLHAQCSVTCTATVPASGTAGIAVSFQSTATPCECSGAATYAWTFGDGNTSTAANPSHTYASNGTYNWQLTVTADSATCVKSGSITIGPAAPVAGTYSGTTSSGHPFSLTVNGSSQITAWQIAFGGLCGASGSTMVSGQSCAVTDGAFSCGTASCSPFATSTQISGTFTSSTSVSGDATLKHQPDAISSCCTQERTFTANLNPALLSASASSDVASGNAPLTVNFTGSASGGTGPYSYAWDFGDCTTSSTQNPSHIYAAGNYNAVLTVTDSTSATAFDIVAIAAAQPGITVSPASGHTTTEAGATSTFTVVLDTQPSANVTIQLDTSDATEGRISTDGVTQQTSVTLTFTTSNWSTAQTITIHGQDDDIDDDNVAYTITTAASDSTDASYDNIDPSNVTATNDDDDAAAYIVTPVTLSVSETATTATFDVSLATEPTGNVVVDIVSNDTGEATVSHAQLTFTSGDYAPQTVTVTGVDDAIADGHQSTTIDLTTNVTTADAVYAALDPANVTVTTFDDDVLTIISTDPIENEKSALRTANIQATASDTVNASTITQSTFRVQGQQTGRINGTYGAAGASFHLDPANDLKAGELITMMATSGIQDNQAVALTPYVWQFRAATSTSTGALTVHPSQGGFDAAGSASVALGDLDGDGDLDAAFGTGNYGGARIWLNNGSGVYSFHTSLTGGDTYDVALGDLDNDGDLDLVIGNSLEAETVWLNDGSANFTELATSMSGDWTIDVSLGDIDGDGDLDCLLSGQGSGTPQTIWLNDGSGGFTPHPTTPSITPSNGANALPLGDLDGDGDLDLVVANGNGQERVYVNDGTGSFSLHQTFPFLNGNDNAWDVALGDIDADLDLDVVVSNGGDQLETVWVNNGSGNFTQLGSFGAGESRDISLGDLDGDGDLDAVVGNFNGSDTVWLNNGSGFFSAHPAVPTLGSGGWGHALGDVDGDGDLDAVFAYPAADQPEKVWLNQRIAVVPNAVSTTEAGGTATFSVVLGRQPSASVTIDVTTGDTTEGRISNDGSTQQNTFTLTFTTSNWSTPQVVTVHGQDDVFADGDIAYTIATSAAVSGDSFYSGVNPDDVGATNINNDIAGVTVTPTTVSVNESGTTATFDVSPNTAVDGTVVIDVASTDTGEATVSHSQLSFTTTTPQTVTVTGVDDAVVDGNDETTITLTMNAAATTDSAYDAIDPDDVVATTVDDEDFVIVSTDPAANAKTAPRTANVAATANDSVNASTVTQSTFRIQGEMTGRIAGAYSASGATFELNPTTDLKPGETIKVTATSGIQSTTAAALTARVWHFTAATATSAGLLFAHPAPSFGGESSEAIALGDLDGDGDLDAIVANSNDEPDTVWENDGTGVFTELSEIVDPANSLHTAVALGDLDGDGDLDAVIASFNAPARVWINGGDGNFSAHPTVPAIGSAISLGVDLADLDGDGDLDAVLANDSGQAETVWLNGGSGNFTANGSFGAGDSQGVSLGDIDNDGDIDILIPNFNDAVRVWANDGAGNFAAHAFPSFGSGKIVAAKLGDLDGDGDLDAVLARYDGESETVWLNANGTGEFVANGSFGTGETLDLALGDMDGDGDLDAVAINLGSNETIWVNDGSGNFTSHASFDGGLNSNDAAVGDLDGDGDLDAVVANGADETETVWENRPAAGGVTITPTSGLITTEAGGTAEFTVVLDSAPSANVTIGFSTTDTSEGLISADFVTTQAGVTLTFTPENWNLAQTIAVYGQDDGFDDGNIAYTIASAGAASTDADYNGVDPDDVSVTNNDDDTASVTVIPTALDVAENGGTNTFDVSLGSTPNGAVTIDFTSTDTGEVLVSPSQLIFNTAAAQTVTVTGVDDGDIDGDTQTTITVAINTAATNDPAYDPLNPADVVVTALDDEELFVVSTDPEANEKAAPRATNVAATANAPVNASTVTQTTYRVQGEQTGRIAGAYSTSGATFTLDPTNDLKPGELIKVTATDGIEAPAGGSLTPRVWQFTAAAGQGTGAMFAHPVAPGFGPVDAGDGVVADFNGDGIVDALIARETALQTWINNGSAMFSLHASISEHELGDVARLAAGDLDGDGDLDVVMAKWFNVGKVFVNDGTGAFTSHSFPTGGAHRHPALGDVDGDGDLDAVVVTGTDHSDKVYLNDGAGNFAALGAGFGNSDGNDVALGDIDGDGDLDAVIAMESGPGETWMNDGGGNFTAHSGTPTFGGNGESVALGDLDADGDLDAVVVTDGATDKVFVNDGTGAFSAHPTTPEIAATFGISASLGDLDGDGDLDLVVGDYSQTGMSSVWMNDGAGNLTAHPVTPTFDNGQRYGGVELGDLDGDGDLDAIGIGYGSQQQTVWINSEITVAPLTGLTTTEAGGTATFIIRVNRQPSSNVTIDINTSDSTEGRISTDGTTQQTAITLTFTSSNWNTPQTITLHGQDDALDDGDIAYTIVTGAASSSDPFFNGINPPDVAATTTDDDLAPTTTTLVSSVNPSTSGQSVTFTATVTSGATGTVTFKDGATAIATIALSGNTAALTTSTLGVGTHPITATYNGDATFATSTSNEVSQVVNASAFGAPPFFNATPSSATQVALTWGAVSGATSYEIHRTTSIGTPFTLLHTTSNLGYTNSGLTTDTTYLYKVRAIGGSGPSAFTAINAATTTIFTDPTLSSAIKIKALHITQLRTAVNAMRAAGGLAPFTFSDPTLNVGVSKLEAVHVNELRSALDAARAAIGLAALTYTDPTLTVGVTKMKAVHVTELRAGVH